MNKQWWNIFAYLVFFQGIGGFILDAFINGLIIALSYLGKTTFPTWSHFPDSLGYSIIGICVIEGFLTWIIAGAIVCSYVRRRPEFKLQRAVFLQGNCRDKLLKSEDLCVSKHFLLKLLRGSARGLLFGLLVLAVFAPIPITLFTLIDFHWGYWGVVIFCGLYGGIIGGAFLNPAVAYITMSQQ